MDRFMNEASWWHSGGGYSFWLVWQENVSERGQTCIDFKR